MAPLGGVTRPLLLTRHGGAPVKQVSHADDTGCSPPAAAVLAHSAATQKYVRAILTAHVNVAQHPLELDVIDNGAELGVGIQRVTGREALADTADFLQYLVLDAVLDQQPRSGRAHFALVVENGVRRRRGRLVQVGTIRHDNVG